MKKYVLAVVTAAAVVAAALIPSGPPVEAATPGFASAVSAIKQTSWQTNNSVNALAISGNTVFAGGLFTKIRQPGKPAGQGEAVRTYVAAFNRSTGAPTAFAPTLNGPVYSIATSPDGNWVVIGGDFTTVNGIKRSKIAMFSVVTGKLVSAWDPVVSARVKALAIFGNSVFIGGAFGKIDGAVRSRLGAVRLIQGDLLPWNPVANGDVYAIDLSDNGTRVFVGGPFSTINGKDHYSLAMTNNTTGAAYSFPAAAAIPKPTATCTTRVKDIDTLGDNVYVSNGGDGGGCYDGVLAAQVSTGGKLLWQNKCLGATEAIKAIGNWVYKGSHAHNCSESGAFPDGTGTHYLLVESAINGKIGPWFPNTDADQSSTTQVGPLAMAGTDTDLWVGGDFLNVNGKPQRGLTRFTNTPGGAAPAVPKAPTVVPSSDKVTVKFADVYDLDNISLTYNVFRGTTNIGSFKYMSYFWEARKTYTVADTGVKSGQTLTYHIEVHDGRNIMKGPSVSVKVP